VKTLQIETVIISASGSGAAKSRNSVPLSQKGEPDKHQALSPIWFNH